MTKMIKYILKKISNKIHLIKQKKKKMKKKIIQKMKITNKMKKII